MRNTTASGEVRRARCIAVLLGLVCACATQSPLRATPPDPVVKIEPGGRLGLMGQALAPAELEELGVTGPGAVVAGVIPGTAAAAAGMQPGDVIVEADGKPVKTFVELVEIVKTKFAGDEMVFVRDRRGARSRVTVKLSPPPENASVELFKLAEGGTAWAQEAIGNRYYQGVGTKQDLSKARYWYKKAAEAGLSAAQVALAQMHERGEGGAADLALAFQWYEKAAAKRAPAAQLALADMHFTGRGVAQNRSVAIDLYQKAAAAGYWPAMTTLGSLYVSGQGVNQDYAVALRLLTPPAQGGLARAQHELAVLCFHGWGVARDHAVAAQWLHAAAAQDYTPSQGALGNMYLTADPPDYQKAFEWSSKAADRGDAQGLNGLGLIYLNGWGVAKDERKAFDYQLRAAEAGNATAQFNIGLLYSEGKLVKRDNRTALKWLQQSLDNPIPADGGTKAKAYLVGAGIYERGGAGVTKSSAKAMQWYERGAREGDVPSQWALARLLVSKKRYKEALPWMRAAAEKGEVGALNDLGAMYINGWGVPKSRVDGIAWLLQAYRQGSPTAKETLQKLGVNAK